MAAVYNFRFDVIYYFNSQLKDYLWRNEKRFIGKKLLVYYEVNTFVLGARSFNFVKKPDFVPSYT